MIRSLICLLVTLGLCSFVALAQAATVEAVATPKGLGIRLLRWNGQTFRARVVDPALLSRLGFRGVRKGQHLTIRFLGGARGVRLRTLGNPSRSVVFSKGLPSACVAARLGGLTELPGGTVLSRPVIVSEMAQMYSQFLALQNATQMEARHFQSLTNAMRTRHDMGASSVRNTR